MKRRDERIAVIGAGIGGMAAAARLAAAGSNVAVFEKSATAGGKLGLLQQDGYTFDTGPSLFTQPQQLEALFADCGKELRHYLRYEAAPEGTRYFWDDGTQVQTPADRNALLRNLAAAFGEDAKRVDGYLDRAAELYHSLGSYFLNEPIHRTKTWLSPRWLKTLRHLRPAYLLKSLHDYNQRLLKHPKLVQIFDRMATYNGSDPYRCPAMLSTIAHLEFNEGAYYPEGGMISIARALQQLCEDLGVVFHFETTVKKILIKDGAVAGVATDAENRTFDAVVSNCDAYYTHQLLLNDPQRAASIKVQERSCSGLVFYWGIRRRFPQLGLHNIFFAGDYRKEFQSIFKESTISGDPTLYLNITAKKEAAHAPQGCENWFVLLNAPPVSNQPLDIPRIRQQVLQKLQRCLDEPIGDLIETEALLRPEDIAANTGAYRGALYGTASNAPMAAFARPSNKSSKYKGLYFAGGTVHPGGGIPLCLRSGRLAAGWLLRDWADEGELGIRN